jgi:hypothetical protein
MSNLRVDTNSSETNNSQFSEVSSRICRADLVVYALIICLGATQLFFTVREPDFPGDDVFWADSGRSLLEHGFYGINGYRETNMPAGLPAILGILGFIWGDSPAVFLHAMAICGTLAFLASYELLRRQVPRSVAAAICLLLMSCPAYFGLATKWVAPSYPFMFTTLSALLVSRKLEEATSLSHRVAWMALLTVLIAVSLSLASAAMAFFGAILASIVWAFLRDRSLALARAKIYLPVLIATLVLQLLWMQHGRVEASAGIGAAEWPLPGFPHSYLAQLKVRNGNDPELGLATPLDIPLRVVDNARAHCQLLIAMLLRLLPPVDWTSIFVILPLLLIVLGWWDSLQRAKGGLQEWYFVAYEFIYLLWPWNLETRFFVPIAPLACLFLWRGGSAFVLLARNKARAIAITSLPVTIALAIFAWFDIHGPPKGSPHRFAHLQDELSFVVWILLAVLSAWIVWPNALCFQPASTVLRVLRRSIELLKISPQQLARKTALALIVGLVLFGLTMQLRMGLANLDPNAPLRDSPDAAAGMWIRDHTDKDVVVMARHVPTVYHYSKRGVVWFPPSSNAQLLMKGIVQNKVDFVIAAHREDSPYYIPPDDDSFASLFATYPNAFSLVCEDPKFRIFRVTQ